MKLYDTLRFVTDICSQFFNNQKTLISQ